MKIEINTTKNNKTPVKVIITIPAWGTFHIKILNKEITPIPKFTLIKRKAENLEIKIHKKDVQKYGRLFAMMIVKQTLNEMQFAFHFIDRFVVYQVISEKNHCPERERIKLITQILESASEDRELFKIINFEGNADKISQIIRNSREEEIKRICQAIKKINHTPNELSTLEHYIIEGLTIASRKINKTEIVAEMLEYKINQTQSQTRKEAFIRRKNILNKPFEENKQ